MRSKSAIYAIATTILFLSTGASAQDTTLARVAIFRVRAVDQPVARAIIRTDSLRVLTDSAGVGSLRLSTGPHTVTVTRIGFIPDTLVVALVVNDTTIEVELSPAIPKLAAVVVSTSRVARRVQDEPERVEVLSGEDVGEKTAMRPANPTTLVSEMPGVQIQTTSPALGGAGVRLQGLRGRYSLLLSDGLPLYGSSSEGLGFLQIPPLDLSQAEVIKGAATALYGPAAAGGVLNLISRRPPANRRHVREFLANQTSRQGTDGLVWIGQRLTDAFGYTLLAGAHRQEGIDVDRDGWTDIPRFTRFEVRPRGFWTSPSGSSAMFTAGAAAEDRESGTRDGSRTPANTNYRVGARTSRGDAGAVARFVVGDGDIAAIRTSLNQQWQRRQFGDSVETDRRGTGLAEATLSRARGANAGLIGAALQYDGLSSGTLSDATYGFVTTSAFAQDTYSPLGWLSLSATGRVDHHDRYGTFVSPRVSILSRLSADWSARISAGSGFFAPTPLVEEADVVGLARIRGFASLTAERISQVSTDLTFIRGPVEVTGTLFAARLAHAVVAQEHSPTPGVITLFNSPTPTRTGGASFFTTYNLEPLSVTALYSFTHSTEWSPEEARRVESPLLPRHAAGLDVALEEDEIGTRVGVEVFFVGRQRLEDDPYRSVSVPFTTYGLLLEQSLGSTMVFINAENLGGIRQTRYDPLLLPTQDPTGRWTTPEWGPLEGRAFNAGVRVRF